MILKNSTAMLAAAVLLLTAPAFSSPETQIKVSAADFNRPGSPTVGIQEAIDSLGQILGTNVKVDVLNQIFNRFCIGK